MRIQHFFFAAILAWPVSLMAQKDSMKLSCPLNAATEPAPEKQPYSLGVEEPKIILTSATDTTVKACLNGTVTTIMKGDDGKWEVIFNNKDFYFYYSGIRQVKVVKGQRLKNGDPIGIIIPGDKIELMVYDFETPVDPKKFLNCGK